MSNIVLVFRTDIHSPREALTICAFMRSMDGVLRCSIDMDDCDKVLKVEGKLLCKASGTFFVIGEFETMEKEVSAQT